MTDVDPNAAASATAGDWLRAAREAEGWSIDVVAQQLKLAPRQVKAIEDGNYAELPGRTFIRGFVRNYARLLRLDPEAVVAALPGVEAAPALEGPAIGSTSRPMGELPVTQASRGGSWSRWAIPVALIAAVLVAAGYEFLRPGAVTRSEAPATSAEALAEGLAERLAEGLAERRTEARQPADAELFVAPAQAKLSDAAEHQPFRSAPDLVHPRGVPARPVRVHGVAEDDGR